MLNINIIFAQVDVKWDIKDECVSDLLQKMEEQYLGSLKADKQLKMIPALKELSIQEGMSKELMQLVDQESDLKREQVEQSQKLDQIIDQIIEMYYNENHSNIRYKARCHLKGFFPTKEKEETIRGVLKGRSFKSGLEGLIIG